MIELVVRHVALLALAVVLSLLLHRRSAALRHALWAATLGLLLFLPLLQRVPITLPEAFSYTIAPVEDIEKEASRAHISGVEVLPATATTALVPQATAPQRLPWGLIAISLYAAITLALIVRWLVGWVMAARLARRAVPLGMARGIPVRAADGVGPLTFGWPRGVILVPHERFALEKLVLRHEVAHVQRADFLWQAISALACALWWWSPLVWLAARQLRREAERACDDFVLNQGVSAPDYADCLLEVAAMKPVSLPLAASLVQGELAARVSALLATGKDRRPAAPLAVLGITALLLPVGLTLTRPVAADVPPAPAPRAVPEVVAPKPARVVKRFAPGPVVAPAKRVAPQAVAPKIAAPKPAAPQARKPAPAPVIAPHGIVSAPAPRIAPPAPKAEPRIAPDGRVLTPAPEVAPAIAPDGRIPAPQPEVAPIVAPRVAPDGRVLTPPAPQPEVVLSGIVPQLTDPVKAPDTTEVIASSSLAGKRIVLDPGHGGQDRGAVSNSGKQPSSAQSNEKDISLAIALNAAERLRKEGAIVTLTRDSDTFVPLNKRAEFSDGQDLYLSIHVDYAPPSLLKNKEYAQQFRVALWFHGDSPTPPTATKAFMDGIVTTFPTRGTKEGISFGIMPDSRVFTSGFAVLRNAKCPAYLIDFGNMSLPADVARLKTHTFQDTLAQSVVNGAKAIL